MTAGPRGRREFLRTSLAAAGALAWRPAVRALQSRIRFAVIGINHGHIHGQIAAVSAGGGQLVSFFASEADLAAAFAKRYPSVRQARSEREILEDFGDVMLCGSGGSGYVRVDWFTPGGLGVFGDGRLTIMGTGGYIEIRKSIDIAGRPGGSHLFLVDEKPARYIDTSQIALPYGARLVDDVLNRTETANAQAQTFLAMDVTLRAQKQAQRLNS